MLVVRFAFPYLPFLVLLFRLEGRLRRLHLRLDFPYFGLHHLPFRTLAPGLIPLISFVLFVVRSLCSSTFLAAFAFGSPSFVGYLLFVAVVAFAVGCIVFGRCILLVSYPSLRLLRYSRL